MTRPRAIARILALLAHAEADTPEGRSAAALATRLRTRHGITDADLDRARGRSADDDRISAELHGWSTPWLALLAGLVGEIVGVGCGIMPAADGVRVVLHGPSAGRAVRRAESVRVLVEARADRLGRAAIARLPSAGPWRPMFVGAGTATSSFSYTFASPALGDLIGADALDVYRLVVARRLLDPEIRAARERRQAQARAEERARDLPREAVAERVDARPREPVQSPRSDPRANANPPTDAPREPPADAAAVADIIGRMERLARHVNTVSGQAPEWATIEPVCGALVEAWVG